MNYHIDSKFLLFIPASLSLCISLILLYKFTFPISWDVYYHIHMADLYMRNGLVFWDYETVAPVGRLIMYPPLFHLFLALISEITGLTLINITKLLQPIFSFFLIFIITYSGYKLFNLKIGVLSGFFGMLSFSTFNRSVICTPATIAMGLFLLTCIYFFIGFNKNKLSNILLSALFFGLICNLHMATALMTFITLGLYVLIQLCRHKINFKYLTCFIIVVCAIGLPWWIYIYINYSLFFNTIPGNILFIPNFFFKYYGIIPSCFTLIGFYFLYKDKSEKSLFLSSWTILLILLSQIGLIGVQTVSIRILEIVSYPLILVAGFGFSKSYDIIKSYKIKYFLLIFIVLVSCLSSVMYVDSYTPDVLAVNDENSTLISHSTHLVIDPIGTIYKPTIISSRFGNSQLAHDRYDVMEWFIKNSNKKLMVSEDSILDTIIVSTSRTPVIYGGFTESIPPYVIDPIHIVHNHSTTNELKALHINYIILQSNTPTPIYAQLIYNNTNYKICIIKEEYR